MSEFMYRYAFEENIDRKYNITYEEHKVTSSSLHWHDYFEIEICLAGNGKTIINQTEYEFKKGTVCLLTPSDIHKYVTDEELSVVNFTFKPEAIEYSNLMEMLFPMKYIIANLSDKDLNAIMFYIEKMRDEKNTDDIFTKKYISLILSGILIELSRKNSNKSDISEFSYDYYLPVQKALYYIRSHFKEDISLNSTAEYAGISPTALSKKFSSILDVGFKEYLTDIRLEYAKLLMANTSESITDIAYYSGFNSLANFQKSFIKKYNNNPKDCR